MNTITPEALELAQVAYNRALGGPGSHAHGLEAAILAALPELLAAQPGMTTSERFLRARDDDEIREVLRSHGAPPPVVTQSMIDRLSGEIHGWCDTGVPHEHLRHLLQEFMREALAQPASSAGGQEPVYQVRHGYGWIDCNKTSYELAIKRGQHPTRMLYAAPVAAEAAPQAVDP